MTDGPDAVAARIDELIAGLRDTGPRAAAAAEELTRCLVRLYGDGLARLVAELGPERTERLCATDPVVEGLLLVHDLHPLDADTRIRRVLPAGSDYLGRGPDGTARVRLAGGCGSRNAVEAAIRQAAPEVETVVVETLPPPLLQLTRRPG